ACGDDRFGIMVAFVVGGCARAAWIALPAQGHTFVAEEGSGAFWNGARIHVSPVAAEQRLRGFLSLQYMPARLGEGVDAAMRGRFRAVPPAGCAAVGYTTIL